MGIGATVALIAVYSCAQQDGAWLAFLLGGTSAYVGMCGCRRKAGEPPAPSLDTNADGLLSLDVAEETADCELLRLDQGRRVIAAGARCVKAMRICPASCQHLVDLFSADEVQQVLLILRTAEAQGISNGVICRRGARIAMRALHDGGGFLVSLKHVEVPCSYEES